MNLEKLNNHTFRQYLLIIMAVLVACFALLLQFDVEVKSHEVQINIKYHRAEAKEIESVDPDERLATKMLAHTPMKDLGPMIVRTAKEKDVNWRLVIGIAAAESGLGKHFYKEYDKENCHNPFGIKPPSGKRSDGSYLRCYNSDQDGVNSIVGLLSRRYKDQTPEQMCGIYVQPCNPNWLRTVNKFYRE